MAGRDFFVGDIHGSFDLLKKLLDRVGFDVGTDRLWSVGDLVDRGEQSLEVVRFFRDTPGCEAVMGNHDAMFLFSESYEVGRVYSQYSGWMSNHSAAEVQEISDYLACLPMSREVEIGDGRRVGIVHATMPESAATFKAGDSAVACGLSGNDAIDVDGLYERGKMLWGRRMAVAAAAATQSPSGKGLSTRMLQRGIALQTTHPAVDLVISGHTPLREKPVRLGNHMFIDTSACFSDGSLTLYEPEEDRLFMLRNKPRARLRAKPAPRPTTVEGWITELKRRGEPLEEPPVDWGLLGAFF